MIEMAGGTIRVDVVHALPGQYWSVPVDLPAGATAADALAASAVSPRAGPYGFDPTRLAVFGRAVQPETRLRDGDRLEVLRALVADPKQARRERAGGPSRGA